MVSRIVARAAGLRLVVVTMVVVTVLTGVATWASAQTPDDDPPPRVLDARQQQLQIRIIGPDEPPPTVGPGPPIVPPGPPFTPPGPPPFVPPARALPGVIERPLGSSPAGPALVPSVAGLDLARPAADALPTTGPSSVAVQAGLGLALLNLGYLMWSAGGSSCRYRRTCHDT